MVDYTVFMNTVAKASAGSLKLVIEDRAQRQRIISSIHDSSHMGVNRSIDMVSQKYYWPGITKDVRSYVSVRVLLGTGWMPQSGRGHARPLTVYYIRVKGYE